MKFRDLKKRICSGVMAGLTAMSMVGTAMPSVTQSITASAAEETFSMPTNDEFIAKACELLGVKYTFGAKGARYAYSSGNGGTLYSVNTIKSTGLDCSGLIYWSLRSMGFSSSGYSHQSPVPASTYDWTSNAGGTTVKAGDKFNWTYKGNTATVTVTKNFISTKKHPYWEDSEGNTIAKGSIVIAELKEGKISSSDHAWIYLGDYSDREVGNDNGRAAVISDIAKITGKSEDYISQFVGDGSGDGGTHWRLECTSTQHDGVNYSGVMIDNEVTGKASNAYKISTTTILPTELKIQKVDSTDKALISGDSKTSFNVVTCTYGIYTSKANAENDRNRVATITIDRYGKGSVKVDYLAGGYYAKEIKFI